jgi:uncharacterized protein GlcG (DUF336 family)
MTGLGLIAAVVDADAHPILFQRMDDAIKDLLK